MTTLPRPRSAFLQRRAVAAAALVLVIAIAAAVVVIVSSSHSARFTLAPNEHDVTAWTSPQSRPLSDSAAAALVALNPENRPANRAANDYVPTTRQLEAFYKAQRDGPGVHNPLAVYVTGRPGIKDPSTDDLIQWASHKWGIPTNWVRAQVAVESYWRQSERGDLTSVDRRGFREYPSFSRVPGSEHVYESVGIASEKWLPGNTIGAGTKQLRWESTAFNLDYYAATIRYYYDGDCSWCTSGYHAGEAWNSVGAWFSPNPWGNTGARKYIAKVQTALAQRVWFQSAFEG
jgi:hypothetical protein